MDSAEAGDTVVPDHDVCAAGMQECAPGNGAYPISFNLGWHGGVHLIAPRDAQAIIEPVRAIADGTVVYVRQNSPQTTALNYRNVRTDDGCVVVRHETEIGEATSATDTSTATVVFFSIYMHLHKVFDAIVAGRKLYRKDKIGNAGEIYGQQGQIHFEIVCDKANLRKLVGRETGLLSGSEGRREAVYGDIWFVVPKGNPAEPGRMVGKLFMNEPHPYRRDDSDSSPVSSIRTQTAQFTERDYVIRMRYERGDCTLTTFQRRSDGLYEEFGSHQAAAGYEYNLYKEAVRLSGKYADLNLNAALVPSASAIYEVLRLGRALGPDRLPENSKFGHWRQIAVPEGGRWINLNLPEISVFSDADFPHWAGWNLIDDDSSIDSLCDSPTVKKWLDFNQDNNVTHAEAIAALNVPAIRERMAKAICKFPSEWAKAGIEARWGWLRRPHEALPVPLSDADFSKLKEHIEALAFWEQARAVDSSLPAWDECWHWPPKAFVEHLRKCGWLSENEFRQLVPRYAMRKHNGHVLWEPVRDPYSLSQGLGPENQRPFVNLTLRKFGISTPLRMASFFGNAIQETQWLGKLAENNPRARYAPWDGRGFLQLTWASNYIKYWDFRGRASKISTSIRSALQSAEQQAMVLGTNTVWQVTESQLPVEIRNWPIDVAESEKSDACESAGFYWSSLRMASHADQPHVLTKVALATSGGQKCYYRSPSFWKASASVNLPSCINVLYSTRLNGFEARCVAYAVALSVLTECRFPVIGDQAVEVPEGQILRRS
ncbi:hydroxyethylthiazole kinase [Paraburkholderia fungorum]|uniref:hydroxyethylthiazole kinase n=1 Tax=Paraburkholderia fungorum TaxID=134537 RepID=UPI0038BD0691